MRPPHLRSGVPSGGPSSTLCSVMLRSRRCRARYLVCAATPRRLALRPIARVRRLTLRPDSRRGSLNAAPADIGLRPQASALTSVSTTAHTLVSAAPTGGRWRTRCIYACAVCQQLAVAIAPARAAGSPAPYDQGTEIVRRAVLSSDSRLACCYCRMVLRTRWCRPSAGAAAYASR